jgi:aarF domain-containing kinase
LFWSLRGRAVIQGGRVDDLAYLAKHKIDRNLVSREIAEITARMIHITGASRHACRVQPVEL